MIDHCIAALQIEKEDKLLKMYITDCCRGILNAVLGFGGVEADTPRWIDLQEDEPPKEQKSSAEIISSIKDKLRKLGGKTDGVDAV